MLGNVPAFIGTIVAFTALSGNASAQNWILAFTAGNFLYIALVDLLPSLFGGVHGHSHSHGHDHDHHDHSHTTSQVNNNNSNSNNGTHSHTDSRDSMATTTVLPLHDDDRSRHPPHHHHHHQVDSLNSLSDETKKAVTSQNGGDTEAASHHHHHHPRCSVENPAMHHDVGAGTGEGIFRDPVKDQWSTTLAIHLGLLVGFAAMLLIALHERNTHRD